MNRHNFSNIFRKMTDVYGSKAYPEERLNQFYESFKFWDDDLFEKAVSIVISESMTPPPLARFSELIFSVRKEQYQRDSSALEQRLEHAADCPVCDKKGSFIYQYWEKSSTTFYSAAFNCLCQAGKLISVYSKAPDASKVIFDFMAKKKNSKLWSETEAMMANGFWHESIIAARIINRYIKTGDDTFLGLLTLRFKINEESYLEINHEFKSGIPGRWNEFFKHRGYLLNYRQLNMLFLGIDRVPSNRLWTGANLDIKKIIGNAGKLVTPKKDSDIQAQVDALKAEEFDKGVISGLIGKMGRDSNELSQWDV